jgi:Tol biopolymer transport system component
MNRINIILLLFTLTTYYCFISCKKSFEPIDKYGHKILYISETYTHLGDYGYLYIMNLDGSNKTPFAKNFIVESRNIAVSPNGSKIIFNGYNPDSYNFSGSFLINSDGSELKYLVDENSHFQSPTFSPDGSKIAARFLNIDEICLMNSDGTDLLQLTNLREDSSWNQLNPKFTPDGTKIVFQTGLEGQLYIYDLFEKHFLKIIDSAYSHPVLKFSLSPDGNKIYYTSHNNNTEISVTSVNIDGSDKVKLTKGFQPDISPNGSLITYIYNRNIHTINSDGSNHNRLTDLTFCTSPHFSPDGKKIIFYGSDSDMFELYDIYIIDSNGKNLKNLTNTVNISEKMPIYIPVY